ncbi:MAG TPA: hypothetical protein VFT29_20650 [Gemmatimonadaceae bacterium]|nr:hypothetical protein [Gemmatimonadaceae bacterium]
MRSMTVLGGLAVLAFPMLSRLAMAQAPASQPQLQSAPPSARASATQTRLEAFRPSPGSLVTLAYDALGDIGFGRVTADVREIRDSKGGVVRGVRVVVTENPGRQEEAFIDPDEIPELLRGIDAILRTQANPTTFKSFELRYRTRGELEVSAYNTDAYVQYAIQVGRGTKATALNLRTEDIAAFRAMLLRASDRLAAASRSPR